MRTQEGFTLVELLIVVAIIGLIAAIAIPNLMNAVNRGRQKRTMADIRSIATAIASYAVDNTCYPRVAGDAFMSILTTWVEPTYLRTLPIRDGWGWPLHWIGQSDGQSYTIWSPARSGGNAMVLIGAGGTTTNFDAHIIFNQDSFAQWPDGLQTGS